MKRCSQGVPDLGVATLWKTVFVLVLAVHAQRVNATGADQDDSADTRAAVLAEEVQTLLDEWRTQWSFRSRWRLLVGRSATTDRLEWIESPREGTSGFVAVDGDLVRYESTGRSVPARALQASGAPARAGRRVWMLHLFRIEPDELIFVIDNDLDRLIRVQRYPVIHRADHVAWAWPLLTTGWRHVRSLRFGETGRRIEYLDAARDGGPDQVRYRFVRRIVLGGSGDVESMSETIEFLLVRHGEYFVLDRLSVALTSEGETYHMLDMPGRLSEGDVPIPLEWIQLSYDEDSQETVSARVFELTDRPLPPANPEDFRIDLRGRKPPLGLARYPSDNVLDLARLAAEDILEPVKLDAKPIRWPRLDQLGQQGSGVAGSPYRRPLILALILLAAAAVLAGLRMYRWLRGRG